MSPDEAKAAGDFAVGLNNDLTIIVNAARAALRSLPLAHPSALLVAQIQTAAYRCTWRASALLNMSARANVAPRVAPTHEKEGSKEGPG